MTGAVHTDSVFSEWRGVSDAAIGRSFSARAVSLPVALVSGVMSAPSRATPAPTIVDGGLTQSGDLLLVVRLGDQRYALPCAAVRRILPMAAPTPFPGAPSGVIGVLAFGGQLLLVIDPRPRLLLATTTPHPQQHLVVLRATTTFLLWVDRAETVEFVAPAALIAIANTAVDVLASQLARLGGESVPVLAPQAFDPGALLRCAAGGGR